MCGLWIFLAWVDSFHSTVKHSLTYGAISIGIPFLILVGLFLAKVYDTAELILSEDTLVDHGEKFDRKRVFDPIPFRETSVYGPLVDRGIEFRYIDLGDGKTNRTVKISTFLFEKTKQDEIEKLIVNWVYSSEASPKQ